MLVAFTASTLRVISSARKLPGENSDVGVKKGLLGKLLGRKGINLLRGFVGGRRGGLLGVKGFQRLVNSVTGLHGGKDSIPATKPDGGVVKGLLGGKDSNTFQGFLKGKIPIQ